MTTTTQFQLGTIISGTMRPEDLLPTLADVIRNIIGGDVDTEAMRATASDVGEVIDALIEIIQEGCPPFVYFGAHPDDGTDFGFWPDHDALEELKQRVDYDRPRHTPPGIISDASHRVLVDFQDYHITVMDLDRNVLWSTV